MDMYTDIEFDTSQAVGAVDVLSVMCMVFHNSRFSYGVKTQALCSKFVVSSKPTYGKLSVAK